MDLDTSTPDAFIEALQQAPEAVQAAVVERLCTEYPKPVPDDVAPAPTANPPIVAILGVVLGAVNLFSWVLPICGFPLSVTGIVLGAVSIKSQRTLAVIAIVLSALGLVASIANAAWGIALALQ